MKKLLLILGLLLLFLNLSFVSSALCKGSNGYYSDCNDDSKYYYEDYYDYRYYHGDNVQVIDLTYDNNKDIKIIEIRNRKVNYRGNSYQSRNSRNNRFYVRAVYDYNNRYRFDDKYNYKDWNDYYSYNEFSQGYRNLDYHDNYYDWKNYYNYERNRDKTIWYRYDTGPYEVKYYRTYYYQERHPVIYVS